MAATQMLARVDAKRAAEIRKERIAQLFQLDPVVMITLKRNDYTLEINNWAVKGVLKDTGVNLMSTGFGVAQMQDPEVMGSILYWGLKTHHPDLQQEDVDKLYSYRHYAYVLGQLRTALDLFLPDMSDVEVDEAMGRTETNADPT